MSKITVSSFTVRRCRFTLPNSGKILTSKRPVCSTRRSRLVVHALGSDNGKRADSTPRLSATNSEFQREKAIRKKLLLLKTNDESTNAPKMLPETEESSTVTASSPFLSGKIEDVLNNPLVELLFAFFCILITACSALDTLDLSPSQAAVTAALEGTIVFVFSLQYIARWWCNGLSLSYVFTPLAIIELCSILGSIWPPLVLLRFARLLQISRLLQEEDYTKIIGMLRPILTDESDSEYYSFPEWQLQLNRVLFTIFCLLVITADLMYTVEHEANPTQFGNFFDSFYFSVVSLNSVGFGDIVPVTSSGRFIISVAILVAALLVPYELSQLAGSLLKVEGQESDKTLTQRPCSICNTMYHSEDALYCRRCGAKLPS